MANRGVWEAMEWAGPAISVAATEADVDGYLATYSYTGAALDSLTRVLLGDLVPGGRLPVTVPRRNGQAVLHPYGHGMEY